MTAATAATAPPGPFDAIVIGSGISGLATAAALSFTGSRVLVLESHFQAGGFTHTFKRKNFEWDVGIHYLGTIHERADWYLQLTALTGGRIGFEPFGPVTDRISFPGLEVEMPRTYEEYAETLAGHFPKERDGIRGYLAEIARTRAGLRGYFTTSLLPRPLSRLARRTVVRGNHRAALTTTDGMMARFIRDEHLRDVLDAQWGNIGMPRRECSFLVHAAMLGYFLENGGFYPRGGSSVFARELGRTIEAAGGAIRLRAEVDRILVRRGRAAGVRLTDGEELLAPVVVSSVGLRNTYDRLLRDEAAAEGERLQVGRLGLAYEYMNLFFGLDVSPRTFGLGRENRWIYRDWDSGRDVFWNFADDEQAVGPKIIFLNSSSLRDPEFREGRDGYSLQVVFIGAQGAFDRWVHTKWKQRGDEYAAFKDLAGSRLLAALDRHFPGLAGHVVHTEVSSALSYSTFTSHAGGVPYGIAPVPERYASLSLRPQSPIKGLFLCGQDLVLPGVSAAFGSGMMCASLIRRRNVGRTLRLEGRRILGQR
jgi:all-trans-retinol 13,14-reductase